jgi:energy-coupling factor transporter ATP-binding protein EcfA2
VTTSLGDRVAALREALDAADGHVDPALLRPSRDLLAKAGARVALGDATVVALAGATGSGKSSLFNALAGSELSAPGVRRPTTSSAAACVWPPVPGSDELLDWLGVPRRHVLPGPDARLAGMVLLDLPDHDSTAVAHRLEVDRLVELVDVLVWVLDPQKYADAAVHDRYLRPYADHAGILLVVLNQADRLEPDALAACLADLARLLRADGLASVPVLPVSARTGDGLDDLRAGLARRVAAKRAAQERLSADVRGAARALAPTGQGERAGREPDRRDLVAALSAAAGVEVVGAAVERSVRGRAGAVTGWPPVRWVRRLRPDPLRRLHLGPGTAGRTSLPQASPVQQAGVGRAVRAAREQASAHLPDPWRDGLRDDLSAREVALPDALDRAVAGVDLGADRTPAWWRGVGALQMLLLVPVAVGALWLLALVGLGLLQLDDVLPVPQVSGLPLPTLLLVLGLLAGALLAVLARPFTRLTARRRRRRAEARLRAQVEEVAVREVLEPLAVARAAYEVHRKALERAAR